MYSADVFVLCLLQALIYTFFQCHVLQSVLCVIYIYIDNVKKKKVSAYLFFLSDFNFSCSYFVNEVHASINVKKITINVF